MFPLPTRPLLIASLLCATLLSVPAARAQTTPLPEPGLMLREGVWNGGVGTYEFPASLANKSPATWPADGWVRLVQKEHVFVLDPVITPPTIRPAFLQTIAKSAESKEEGTFAEADSKPLYLRVPGSNFRSGPVTPYKFKNGTSRLLPTLDYRYELKLGDQAFAFRAQNGLRSKDGKPYGDGAYYFIEYDGKQYSYRLEGFGWDSNIQAIADFDGDGKPDFLIYVGGSNSSHEYLLLSSQAKPGVNPPTASLHSMGC
jgi:hypothetical protein